MTSHELAQELLKLPDVPVTAHDGMDPSDICEITDAELIEEDKGCYNEVSGMSVSKKHIRVY